MEGIRETRRKGKERKRLEGAGATFINKSKIINKIIWLLSHFFFTISSCESYFNVKIRHKNKRSLSHVEISCQNSVNKYLFVLVGTVDTISVMVMN